MFENKHIYRIDDRKLTRGCMLVKDLAEAKMWNENKWGIFFSPNTFRTPSREEYQKDGTALPRNQRYLQSIDYIFADIDVAKAEDNLPLEDVQKKKDRVFEALCEHCPPTCLIETRNGWQPLWKVNAKIEDRATVVNITNGIIAWSKDYGAFGDEVKDTEHILRLSGFYHHKQEPYLVTHTVMDDRVFTLEELQQKFPFTAPVVFSQEKNHGESIFDTVPLVDILTKAFSAIGRKFELDGDGHRVILDGRVTGNFIDRKTGNSEYLATSSGTEPYKGNRITAVASILGCNNREAVEWLKREFKLNPAKESHPVPALKTLGDSVGESWSYLKNLNPSSVLKFGIPELDTQLGGIFEGEVWLLGGETGTGKTTFASSILRANEKRAKVAHILLEDTQQEYDLVRLYYAVNKIRKGERTTNIPWSTFRTNSVTDPNFPRQVTEAIDVLRQSSVLIFRQQTADIMNTDQLLQLFAREAANGVRLFCVDHLHFFEHGGEKDELKTNRIENTLRTIKRIADSLGVAVVVVAHYRKLNGQKPTIDSFKDSMAFGQIATGVINLWRDRENMVDGPISETLFLVPKTRSPVGEMTFTINFDKRTGDFEFVSQEAGTPSSAKTVSIF